MARLDLRQSIYHACKIPFSNYVS